MGMAHILWVYEDGLTLNSEKGDRLEAALGQAVFKLCMNPDYAATEHGTQRIRSHKVLNQFAGVCHLESVHSSDRRLFVWADNCLRGVGDLTDEELQDARALFEAELARRSRDTERDDG